MISQVTGCAWRRHTCSFEALQQALSDGGLKVEVVVLLVRGLQVQGNVLEHQQAPGRRGGGGRLELLLQPAVLGLPLAGTRRGIVEQLGVQHETLDSSYLGEGRGLHSNNDANFSNRVDPH